MIRYQNTKTNSLINVPENIKIKDVDDWAYIIKMMIYHDEWLVKQKIQNLVNCLYQIKEKKLKNI